MKVLFIAFATMLLLIACRSEQAQEPEPAVETVETPAPRTEPAREPSRTPEPGAPVVPRSEGQLEEAGYGLALIVDGTSTASFHESLELIASETSQEQYQSLDAAIRYLQVYSPHAWGGRDSLYASLDGMTGEEIIAQAGELQRQRSQR